MTKPLRDAQIDKELTLLNKIIEQRALISELTDTLDDLLGCTSPAEDKLSDANKLVATTKAHLRNNA